MKHYKIISNSGDKDDSIEFDVLGINRAAASFYALTMLGWHINANAIYYTVSNNATPPIEFEIVAEDIDEAVEGALNRIGWIIIGTEEENIE